MAGDGGGDARTECGKVFILLRFQRVRAGLLDDLGEHPFQSGTLKTDRGGFHSERLRAKRFDLKSVTFEFLGDAGEDHHLGGLEFDQHGHEESLALDMLHLAVAKNLFKEHALVCHMLVDNPQAVFAGGQNEGLAQLAEGPKRTEVVENGGGLFGFDLRGRRSGGIR